MYDTLGPSRTAEFHSKQVLPTYLLSLVQDFTGFVFVSVMAYTETNICLDIKCLGNQHGSRRSVKIDLNMIKCNTMILDMALSRVPKKVTPK